MCHYCEDCSKQFKNVNAVHKYMEGKSHCKLHYGDDGAVEEEIAEFYDFSSRYDCTHCRVTFDCCCGDFSATSSSCSLSIVSFSSPNKCEVSYSFGVCES